MHAYLYLRLLSVYDTHEGIMKDHHIHSIAQLTFKLSPSQNNNTHDVCPWFPFTPEQQHNNPLPTNKAINQLSGIKSHIPLPPPPPSFLHQTNHARRYSGKSKPSSGTMKRQMSRSECLSSDFFPTGKVIIGESSRLMLSKSLAKKCSPLEQLE